MLDPIHFKKHWYSSSTMDYDLNEKRVVFWTDLEDLYGWQLRAPRAGTDDKWSLHDQKGTKFGEWENSQAAFNYAYEIYETRVAAQDELQAMLDMTEERPLQAKPVPDSYGGF